MCTVLLPPGDNPIAVNKYITTDEGERPAPVALSPETEPGASNGQDYVSAKEPKLME